MITPANRAIELKSPFQGEGAGDPTKRKVKLRTPNKTTEKPTEPPTRSQSVNGQDVSQTGYYADQFNKIFVEDVPTQGVNEKANEIKPNLNISGVGQNLYPTVQDNTRQNIGTPINPKDPQAGEVQGSILDTPAGKMLMDNLFMTGATKESTGQIMQGLGEMTNGESSKGFQRTILGGLGLTGAPFTALDQNAQNIPDIGQFVSGVSSLPFMLMGEAGKISNEKVRNFLGIKLADKEQEQLADEIAGVLAQFVIPMGIEGGVKRFGIKPEKLIEIKTKIDAIPQEIKTPENIKTVVQGLLPEGSKFKNTVDPQGNVTREKIPTGDFTSSPVDKITESKKNIESNPLFPEPLPKVDNYAGINDLGATENVNLTKGLKSNEPSKKQLFKDQIEPELKRLAEINPDAEKFMMAVQRQYPKNYEQIGNYLQDFGYTVDKGTTALKQAHDLFKSKEQINPKEEYIKNLPEPTAEEKTRAKDFVDLKREANLNLNSVGDLKLDKFEIRKGLNDIKKEVFDTKEAKLVLDKINKAYEQGISGNNDRGDFRKPNYMSADELKTMTEHDNNIKTVKDALSKKSLDMSGLSKLVDLTDKKVLKATYQIAKHHFETGLNEFGKWARQMVKDTGAWIKPHLRTLWNEVKAYATGNKRILSDGSIGLFGGELARDFKKNLEFKDKGLPDDLVNKMTDDALKMSKEDFAREYNQSNLMDLSNRDKHRVGRVIDWEKESKRVSLDEIANKKGNDYLTDIKYDNPEVYRNVLRAKQTGEITIYRSIPKDAKTGIEAGDFVALTKDYADSHGGDRFGEKWKTVSEKVPLEDVVWGEADFSEWHYAPKKLREAFGDLESFHEKANKNNYKAETFKGKYDDKVRFEIDDSKSKLKTDLYDDFVEGKTEHKLSDILKHDELYKNYPEFKDIPVKVKQGKEYSGQYNPAKNEITLNITDAKDERGTILHELQHAIQEVENFARGGNSDMFALNKESKADLESLRNELKKNETDLYREKSAFAEQYWDKEKIAQLYKDRQTIYTKMAKVHPTGNYLRLAGEIEARDVQARMDLTNEQRDPRNKKTLEDFSKSPDEDVTPTKDGYTLLYHKTISESNAIKIKNEGLLTSKKKNIGDPLDKMWFTDKRKGYSENGSLVVVQVPKDAVRIENKQAGYVTVVGDIPSSDVLRVYNQMPTKIKGKTIREDILRDNKQLRENYLKDPELRTAVEKQSTYVEPYSSENIPKEDAIVTYESGKSNLNPPERDKKLNKVDPEVIPMGSKESQFEYNKNTVHGDIEKEVRKYVSDNLDYFKEIRRGRITDEQLIKQATKIATGLTKDKAFDMLRTGATLSAEKHLAVVGFTSKLIKDLIKDKSATSIDKSEAFKLYAKSEAVSAELGRALRSRQLVPKLTLDEMKSLVKDVPEELKPDIQKILDEVSKDPEAVNNPKLMDKIRYYIYNAMLSRPLTHARNIIGNTSHLLYEALLTGDLPSTLRGLKRGGSKIPTTLKRILNEGGEASKFIEGKQYEPENKYLRNSMPTTWLKIEDVVFKELSKGIETEIQGKQISKELKVSPDIVIKGIENVMKGETLKNPVINDRLIKAIDEINGFAEYVTFQKELGTAGKKFQGMINAIPGGFLVVPFIRTPANILKVGLQPLKVLKFASKEYRAEFRDMTPTMKRKELTRMTAGAMTMGLLAYLTANGTIDVTGQGADDKSKKDFMEKQGWKPNSVKIGDKYISYQNTNPFNVFLGILGNYSDGLKYNYRPKDDELNIIQKMSKTTAGFVQTVTDQSFLQGLSNLAKWQETKDPYYFEQFLQMPVPGVLSAYKDLKGDNTAYEQKTFGDKLSNRLGTTDGLKPRINVFGEPEKTSGTGLPIPTQETPDALSKLLLDNNVTISYPKKDIIKSDGQKVTDDEYYNFVKESGQRIKKKLDDNFETIKGLTAGDMNDLIDNEVRKIRDDVKEEMFGKKEKQKTNKIKLK